MIDPVIADIGLGRLDVALAEAASAPEAFTATMPVGTLLSPASASSF